MKRERSLVKFSEALQKRKSLIGAIYELITLVNLDAGTLSLPKLFLEERVDYVSPKLSRPATQRKAKATVKAKADAAAATVKSAGIRPKASGPTKAQVTKAKRKLNRRAFVEKMGR